MPSTSPLLILFFFYLLLSLSCSTQVGMVACNDYIILDTMIYRILQVKEGARERGV